MSKKILIIGSTGTLGSKLLNYCNKNNLSIFAITAYKNKRKLYSQKFKSNIYHSFVLSLKNEYDKFLFFLKNNKFDLVYFLDYGSKSLIFLNLLILNQKSCLFAIANKEMIIAGGKLIHKKVAITKNKIIPLDSEHFSLFEKNFDNNSIHKIYITASGGPFYFNKRINLNNVLIKDVLNHPKWKMGINNTLDSSNFINKILEIFELCVLFDIDIKKVDFLVSKEAFVHSLIVYKDNSLSINCFNNDMIITLIKPLSFLFELKSNFNLEKKIFNIQNFKLEEFNDKRFKIKKILKMYKHLDHRQQIQFMMLNNIAHDLYLKRSIKYNQIVDFIIKNLNLKHKKSDFSSFEKVLSYIEILKSTYVKLY